MIDAGINKNEQILIYHGQDVHNVTHLIPPFKEQHLHHCVQIQIFPLVILDKTLKNMTVASNWRYNGQGWVAGCRYAAGTQGQVRYCLIGRLDVNGSWG